MPPIKKATPGGVEKKARLATSAELAGLIVNIREYEHQLHGQQISPIADEIYAAACNNQVSFWVMGLGDNYGFQEGQAIAMDWVRAGHPIAGGGCTLMHEWKHLRDEYMPGAPGAADPDHDCRHAVIVLEQLVQFCDTRPSPPNDPQKASDKVRNAHHAETISNYYNLVFSCEYPEGLPVGLEGEIEYPSDFPPPLPCSSE